MIMNLIALLVSDLNLIAFPFSMIGWDRIRAFFQEKDRKKQGLYFLLIFLAALSMTVFRIYMLYFFLAEYVILLFSDIRQGKKSYFMALRGIINMLVVTATGLAIYAASFYHLHMPGVQAGIKWDGLSVTCCMAMLMMSYFMSLLWDFGKLKKRMGLMGCFFFAAKMAENMLLVYLVLVSIAYDDRYILVILVLLLTLAIDYSIFLHFLGRTKTVVEQKDASAGKVNQYEYYLNMEEEHRQIRKLYHEMKNKLMIMQEEGRANAKLDGLQSALDEIDRNRISCHTGYSYLDALLFDAERKARDGGISFEAVISEGCLSFMDEEDAVVIFRNAVLNALEACKRIQEGEKWIRIKAGENGDSVMIYIKNSASADRQQGKLQTIKEDKKLHGIGLTTIRECVENYGGYLSVIEEENSFQLAMLFTRGGVKENEENKGM